MLNGPGDPDRDVEIQRHYLADLAHLPVVRRITGVHRRPGRAHGGPEPVGDRLDRPKPPSPTAGTTAVRTVIPLLRSCGRAKSLLTMFVEHRASPRRLPDADAPDG